MTQSSPNSPLSASESDASLTEMPENSVPQCCGGPGKLLVGSLAGLVVVLAVCCAYFAGRSSQADNPKSQFAWAEGGEFPLIDASAAVSSDNFSIATGQISEDAEGLMVLDHNSGLLTVSVIYPRQGQVMATFSATVGEVLASGGKGGKYMMVSGMAAFPRASNNPVGGSVIYVMNSTTGDYVGYAVPFNRQFVATARQQSGKLIPLVTGSANPLITR